MNRLEMLLFKREKILAQLAIQGDRTKWLITLMDIDDELNQGRNVQ